MTMEILINLIQEQKLCRYEQLYEVICFGRKNDEEESYESDLSYEKQMRELIENCCKEDVELLGNTEVLHNISVELAKQKYYYLACMLLEKTLKGKKCFTNIDLLADYLKYSTYSSESEIRQAEEYYGRLQKIEKKLWSWRAFDFSIDYLLARSDTTEFKEDDLMEALKLALIYRAQMKNTPDEDKALNTLAEVYLRKGETKKYEQILKQGILLKKAPLCTLKWGEYLFKKGDYANAQENILKCCKANTGLESVINIGYPYVLLALARIMNLYAHQDSEQDHTKNDFGMELKLIETDYQTAKEALGESNEQIKNLKKQIDVLKKQLATDTNTAEADYDE